MREEQGTVNLISRVTFRETGLAEVFDEVPVALVLIHRELVDDDVLELLYADHARLVDLVELEQLLKVLLVVSCEAGTDAKEDSE